MSQRITILPETITNKIAAGEVVERPASVLKELLENSLDAGATEIIVEVSAGGRRLIRVSDNGYGMSKDDALLSFERHATSKIRSEKDLESILTLGFRGEALPSIASVSRFHLATRERGSIEGVKIFVEGGRIREVKECGMATGTVISVEQLFFNTPARLKFLKTPETEQGHISDIVTRMAISRPDVAFTLLLDGKVTLSLQRGDLLRRLSQTVGNDSATRLFELHHEAENLSITGYISTPPLIRSNAAALYTYINGRFVRDKVVQHALLQGYRSVLDRGRYPVVAVFITIPTEDVDVNVHPTKHEVRFRRQGVVHDFIQSSVETLLRTSPWLGSKEKLSTSSSDKILPQKLPQNQEYHERVAAAAQSYLAMPKTYKENGYKFNRSSPFQAPATASTQNFSETVAETASSFSTQSPPDRKITTGYFSGLQVIGQFHGEYILCQDGEDLLIIDQHAASERVAFQRLREQFSNGGIERQPLLFPETIELSHSEVVTSQKYKEQLLSFGFELEPFGGGTMLLTAVPQIAVESGAAELLRDILSDLNGIGQTAAFQEKVDSLLARIACHSVVRGVYKLEERQIRELLIAMDHTDFAASCPHGRPVSHIIRLKELEKIFKRI